jgi:hypothetical protein
MVDLCGGREVTRVPIATGSLLRCISPLLARSEHAASRWLWLLSEEDRTLDRRSLLGRRDPIALISRVEISQRSNLLPYRGVLFLSFVSTGGTGQ